MEYTVYHYSDSKFDKFDADQSDGFWFTNIAPTDSEMLEEIGADGMTYCAKCTVTINEETENGNNYDVAETLKNDKTDGIINIYDGFTDYAVLSNEQISILEWIEV